MGSLHTYEKDHQLDKEMMSLVRGFGGRRAFEKGKRKGVQGAPDLSQIKKVGADQASAECFCYKKQGHWKRNYPLYQVPLDMNRPRKEKQQNAGQGIYMIDP